MKLQNVDLVIRTNDTSLIPETEKALKELDILLEANYSGFTEEYRKQMSTGRADITFFPKGVVADGVEGRVMVIGLGCRKDTIPSVVVKGLENLCPPCELSYESNSLSIVRREGNPIRYSISSARGE